MAPQLKEHGCLLLVLAEVHQHKFIMHEGTAKTSGHYATGQSRVIQGETATFCMSNLYQEPRAFQSGIPIYTFVPAVFAELPREIKVNAHQQEKRFR
jgi:hypothetical protein